MMVWSWIAISLIILLLIVIIIILLVNQSHLIQNISTIDTSSKSLPCHAIEDDIKTHEDPVTISDDFFDMPIKEEDDRSIIPSSSNISPEGYYKPKGLIREQVVCQTLEKLYNKGFPTVRPDFLINPETGQLLEYDCYNEELKISAEHNGEHHYHYPNAFHKTVNDFQSQVRRDKYKYDISNTKGIYQITVPYWVPLALIPKWVEYYCPEHVMTRQKIEKLINNH